MEIKQILKLLKRRIWFGHRITNRKSYEKYPYLEVEQAEQIQLLRLKKVLKYAVTKIPYYANLKLDIDFDNFTKQELLKFPVVNKQIIRENYNDFYVPNFFSESTYTSGSSGSPFKFRIPLKSKTIEDLIMFRAWNMGKSYSHKKGDPVVALRSYSPKKGQPLFNRNRLENCWYLSPFDINESNLDLYVEVIKKSKAKLIRAYPSSLYIFTLLLEKKGIKLPQIKLLKTSSETLLPLYREVIENYWGIKILDWYGQNERTVLVTQCWAGNYHNHDDYGILEIAQNNEIIATSLNNTVMPFIRYHTGDKAIALDKPIKKCPCGRTLSIPFKGIEGRSDDVLIKKDGTLIPSVNFSTAMMKFKGISQFQIEQNTEDKKVLIKIVKNEFFKPEDKNNIQAEMVKRLGEVAIEIEEVDEILRDKKTGKIKMAILKSKNDD